MSEIPNYSLNVSRRLSKVLDEIGVNERMVMKIRRLELMNETLRTIGHRLTNEDVNVYLLGSRVEGTTTLGLHSDTDELFTCSVHKVIQDCSEWEIGKENMLMIQDDTVSPGYCLLQKLRTDVPLPEDVCQQRWCRDSIGRVLLKNSIVNIGVGAKIVRHGPAQSIDETPGFLGYDFVLAYPCQQWPLQARQWINQQGEGKWPTNDMTQYCKGTGCFVVGVGGKGSVNEDLEWRISTSLAERFLMFNLNITQIRCYVLMKMVLKTIITTQCPDNSISSFMCKTVMLHCISSTNTNAWNENTLLICLNYCLTVLYNCVLNEYCPHFIIPKNNLMAGRFTPVTKHIIKNKLCYIISSKGSALLEIECDRLGFRIQNTFLRLEEIVPEHNSWEISGQLITATALIVNENCTFILKQTNGINHIRLLLQTLYKYVMKVNHELNQGQNKLAYIAMAKFLIIHLGSALASINLQSERSVSRESIVLMTLGLNIDVASGKLKLASIFYCTGDIERTELILKNIEESYDLNVVEPICKCYVYQQLKRKTAFSKLCYESDNDHTLLQSITASCVRFLRCEINCCPRELQHEMFRSPQQDLPRSEDDEWMDLAVVDSLPFLYFLQYKTYSHHRRHRDQQAAISNLAKCIVEEQNFGHKETALNLLGQCMEQENRMDAALNCYMSSLKIRDRNNAAKVHICRLVSAMLSSGFR